MEVVRQTIERWGDDRLFSNEEAPWISSIMHAAGTPKISRRYSQTRQTKQTQISPWRVVQCYGHLHSTNMKNFPVSNRLMEERWNDTPWYHPSSAIMCISPSPTHLIPNPCTRRLCPLRNSANENSGEHAHRFRSYLCNYSPETTAFYRALVGARKPSLSGR